MCAAVTQGVMGLRLNIVGLLVLAISGAYVGGCGQSLDISPAEVQSEIEQILVRGVDSTTIESYFEEKELPISYDKHANRYQSIIRHPESDFHAIVIYVNVDKDMHLVSVEAHDSYTAP